MAKKEKALVREFNEFPDLVEVEFDQLVRDYRAAHLAEVEAKATKDRLKVDIESWLDIAQQKSLRVGNLIAVKMGGSSPSQLDTHLLMQAGVDADVIVACTIPGTPY